MSRLTIATAMAALLLLTACERRPLEVYTQDMAAVAVEVDWMKYFGQRPSGMTLLVYDEDDALVRSTITNDVDRQQLFLPLGTYRLTVFNHSYDEYASMRFADMSSHTLAATHATTLTTHQLDYWEQPTDGRYIQDPEDIGVATDTITITPEMIGTGAIRFADYHDRHKLQPDTAAFTFNEAPVPMTVTLFIKAKVKRRQSVNGVAAYITGMADGFYINRVNRTATDGTLYLPDWTLQKVGDDADSLGIITTEIKTFGLPFGRELSAQRDSTDNILTFHLMLTDNTVQDCSFRVGRDIRYIYPTGREAQIRRREDLYDLRIELDLTEVIVAPPKPPVQSGTGFEAWVDPWEEGGTIEFGM